MTTLTVTPGRGGTRIQVAKYEATKKALLSAVPRSAKGVAFRDLPRLLAPKLPKEMLSARGSATWLVTVVKLDLEARGVIERVPSSSPQRLRRVK